MTLNQSLRLVFPKCKEFKNLSPESKYQWNKKIEPTGWFGFARTASVQYNLFEKLSDKRKYSFNRNNLGLASRDS